MTQLEHQFIAVLLCWITYFLVLKKIFNTEKRKIAWTAYVKDKILN